VQLTCIFTFAASSQAAAVPPATTSVASATVRMQATTSAAKRNALAESSPGVHFVIQYKKHISLQ